jgi:hypothetical protein
VAQQFMESKQTPREGDQALANALRAHAASPRQ